MQAEDLKYKGYVIQPEVLDDLIESASHRDGKICIVASRIQNSTTHAESQCNRMSLEDQQRLYIGSATGIHKN